MLPEGGGLSERRNDEFRLFAQAGKLVVMQSAFDGVALFIGLAQIKTAMIQIAMLAVHLGHDIMEVAEIIRSHQANGDGGCGGLALENFRINLDGALVFLGGAVEILLREISPAQIAVEAGTLVIELDGLLVFPDGRAIFPERCNKARPRLL